MAFRSIISLTLLVSAALSGAVIAGETPSGLAAAEVERRAARVMEAQELLKQGDAAYEAGRYEEAVSAYRGAIDGMPANAAAAAPLRQAALQRFAQASVERAKEQRRLGDNDGALASVEAVLDESIAPYDPLALAERERILDPIRTNPAGSKEHTADIEEVRLLLYKAQGFFDLGDFDKASVAYEEVLRIDPYNKAARRGMERTAAARSDYFRAAYDQARGEMLSDVAGAWELGVPPLEDVGELMATDGTTHERVGALEMLEQMIVPIVSFEQVSLQEAVDFIRQQSIELDTLSLDPESRGINFFVDLGGSDSEVGNRIRSKRINLTLRNVPLSQVLAYVNEATQTIAISEPFAVRILPAGSDRTDLTSRTYRVSPDFLSTASAGGSGDGAAAADDPFAEASDEGLLARRLTAEEVLKSNGVSFPEGASAAFNPANSTLRVRNTPDNQALVDQIVQAVSNTEPVSVIIKMTMLKSTRTRMEELGFDWLLGEFGTSGSTFLSGGTVGNGDRLDDVALPPGEIFRRPLTSGNRSGDSAFSSNGIDDLIFEANQGFAPTPARAPGALWVNGLFDDSHVTVLMRALDQKKGIEIMSTPSVVTRSGQTADVRVVREFIYPEEYEPPEVPNSVGGGGAFVDLGTGTIIGGGGGGQAPVTPATPTSFTMRETGTVLEVLPTVSGNRQYVDLTLKPEIIDFDGFVNYGSPINAGGGGGFTILNVGGGVQLVPAPPQELTPNRILMPVFSVIRSESALTIADGQTVVIGGLFQETIEVFEDKVPILGSIPLVGRLFQSTGSAPSQTAIVLMVNVQVVDAAGRPFNP